MLTQETRLVRLEERFKAFEINRERRDREVDGRMDRIEALQRYVGENTEMLMASLELFINPMRWLRRNWFAVAVLGGTFTILGGAGVGSALKILNKFIE